MQILGETVEKRLLNETAGGDQSAFTQLFDAYHHALGAYVFGILKSRETAEEVVLDVFLKIWTTREALADVNDFKAYLFTITKNAALSALRKAIRERARRVQWEGQQNPAPADDNAEREQYFLLIDEAISQLSPQRKKIYLLSRQEGMKYDEIARQLGLSSFTVRAHIQQAVAAITAFLKARIGQKSIVVLLLLELIKK